MAELEGGPVLWSATRDDEGHREYKVRWKVRCESTEGPATAMQVAGLPLPGSTWSIDDDLDVWAWCRKSMDVSPAREQEPNKYFWIDQTFSTKPTNRCQDDKIEDPLLEPQRISGGFTKYTEEATHDRFGTPLVNHAFEPIRGSAVEFDGNRPTVRIEQNVVDLQLNLLYRMADNVNAFPLWGFPPRCIKLSSISWERKFHGTCNVYYTRTLEFGVNAKIDPETGEVTSGFDRNILNEGTKVLNGYWGDESVGGAWVLLGVSNGPTDTDSLPPNPNPNNPLHYIRATDRLGNPLKIVYDGRSNKKGQPYNPDELADAEWVGNIINACAQCLDGIQRFWKIEYNFNGQTDQPYVDHDADCDWSGTLENGDTVRMYFDGTDWIIETDTMAGYWWCSADNFSCGGPNLFTAIDEELILNQGLPSTLVASVDPVSEPGYIYVEKYPEADFLQLNIPIAW